MTNTAWYEDDESLDNPVSSPRPPPSWRGHGMHLHAHYRPSNQPADTVSNNNNNIQQDGHLDVLELDFDVDIEQYLDMQNFDTTNVTADNIDPNLGNNGPSALHASAPHPAPQYIQSHHQVAGNSTNFDYKQNNDMHQTHNQSAASQSDHHYASAYDQINTGIAPAQLTNISTSDLIRILTARHRGQHALQIQPHCLPPSEQHGMGQPSFNINTSNFNFAPQQNLHPDSNRNIQYFPHTIDSQGNITFLDDENQQFDFQAPDFSEPSNTTHFEKFGGPPTSPNTATPFTPATASSPGFASLQGPSTTRKPSEKTLCAEEQCKRGARPNSNYCKRHQEKWDRNHAGAPVIPYLQEWTFDRAMRELVYPHYPIKGLDYERAQAGSPQFEAYWVQRFLNALTVQVDDDVEKFYKEQQKKFNGAALMENKNGGRYSPEWVNARMRMLFRSVYVFHFGGPAVYPVGGDNGGYGKADASLQFFDRLRQLEGVLAKNKLIAGDVIEGRGVMALVENPEKYEKRKSQNKQSNLKKDEVLEAERKRQRDAAEEDDEDDDADEPTSSRAPSMSKRRKSTPASPRGPQTRLAARMKSQAKAETPDSQAGGSAQITTFPPFAPMRGQPQGSVESNAEHHSSPEGFAECPNVDDRELLDKKPGL